MSKSTLKLFILATCLVGLGGCMRGCTSSRPPIHPNPNMDRQPKYIAQSASDFFYDGSAMRQPIAGAVARGELFADTVFHTGQDEAGSFVARGPLAVDEKVMARGEERYNIYCQPCHGGRGNGRGVLFDHGIVAADLHDPRFVDMPDGQMFDVITNGLGLMAGYKYPVPPHDRWAIIAYVRKLQEGAAP